MTVLSALFIVQAAVAQPLQAPALAFPEAGLDDPAAYEGYATRFYRDSGGNTLQVYVEGRTGRVVHVWADAANESAAMTLRNASGEPAALAWGSEGAATVADGPRRSVRHTLTVGHDEVEIGWFLLGTMRQERDFQYLGLHARPWDDPPFVLRELTDLVEALESVPEPERTRHLSILGATSLDEVRRRLRPRIVVGEEGAEWVVSVEHLTLDGRNRLALELRGDAGASEALVSGEVVRVRALAGEAIELGVVVTTDARALEPFDREALFNEAFLGFFERQREEGGPEFRRLERDVRALELVSYGEKLLASLPNYATYFGRDMMMAAMMLEPVVSVDVQETVIGAMLGKLDASGDVSHEEALGGQAIREAAVEYAALIRRWAETGGDAGTAAATLDSARAVLDDLQRVRENHHMVDDDLQLPVLAHRYLTRVDVPASRKRAFLADTLADGRTHLGALAANLALVAAMARPYALEPVPIQLVGFPRRDEDGWLAGSWRDSREGYGRGRFAMDVNVIWVPSALRAMEGILAMLADLGLSPGDVVGGAGRDAAALAGYVEDPSALRADLATWRGARRHFEVELAPEALRARIEAWLGTLGPGERAYWSRRLVEDGADRAPVAFLAVALDDDGAPIPVMNTDPATELFLEDYTEDVLAGHVDGAWVLELIDAFLRPYPVGLFVQSLGPLVANDAYTDATVQERFRADAYHSPTVVWGREVNLFLLGLARQLGAAYDDGGRLREGGPDFRSYVDGLRRALEVTTAAVEASGLRHNELWSYRIDDGELRPVRYGTSSDIQLWNLTDLAVRYLIDALPGE